LKRQYENYIESLLIKHDEEKQLVSEQGKASNKKKLKQSSRQMQQLQDQLEQTKWESEEFRRKLEEHYQNQLKQVEQKFEEMAVIISNSREKEQSARAEIEQVREVYENELAILKRTVEQNSVEMEKMMKLLEKERDKVIDQFRTQMAEHDQCRDLWTKEKIELELANREMRRLIEVEYSKRKNWEKVEQSLAQDLENMKTHLTIQTRAKESIEQQADGLNRKSEELLKERERLENMLAMKFKIITQQQEEERLIASQSSVATVFPNEKEEDTHSSKDIARESFLLPDSSSSQENKTRLSRSTSSAYLAALEMRKLSQEQQK
jgi:hypothetical protein